MHNKQTYTINAPLPGKIVNIKVKIGDKVKANEILIILEAMKMENEIVAEIDGIVKEIKVKAGDIVNTDDEMIIIENT